MGTRKMAADQAIIKDLKAVESLVCVSVICSDKTGTLTQNKMTVQQLYTCDTLLNADQLDLHIPAHRYFLYNCILNNDSSIRDGKDIGDPTETCLLTMSRKTILFDVGVTEEVLLISFRSESNGISSRRGIRSRRTSSVTPTSNSFVFLAIVRRQVSVGSPISLPSRILC